MAMSVQGPGHPRFDDLTGQRFGRLVVERYDQRTARMHKWLCRCDCGTKKSIWGTNLRRGNTTSCGCLRRERATAANTFHGGTIQNKSGEYLAWQNMLARCLNASCRQFKDYGGRGIQVCERWQVGSDGLSGFQCFLADMGLKPSPEHSLDRQDVNGSYDPLNCRWATKAEQDRNKRSNVWIEYEGRRLILADALIAIGQNYTRFLRIRRATNLSAQEAFDRLLVTPLRRKH